MATDYQEQTTDLAERLAKLDQAVEELKSRLLDAEEPVPDGRRERLALRRRLVDAGNAALDVAGAAGRVGNWCCLRRERIEEEGATD